MNVSYSFDALKERVKKINHKINSLETLKKMPTEVRKMADKQDATIEGSYQNQIDEIIEGINDNQKNMELREKYLKDVMADE